MFILICSYRGILSFISSILRISNRRGGRAHSVLKGILESRRSRWRPGGLAFLNAGIHRRGALESDRFWQAFEKIRRRPLVLQRNQLFLAPNLRLQRLPGGL